MTNLKLKHYFLFFVTFFILWFNHIPVGAIILIILWQQMGLYLWKNQITASNQILVLIHSIGLLPLFFFLGAIGSFVPIYLNSQAFHLFLLAATLTLILNFLIITSGFSLFFDMGQQAHLREIYQKTFSQLKYRKLFFFKITFVFFILQSICLFLLPADYAIVLSYVAAMIMARKLLELKPESFYLGLIR